MRVFLAAVCFFLLFGCQTVHKIRSEVASYVKPSSYEETDHKKLSSSLDCNHPSDVDVKTQLQECHRISLQEIEELRKNAEQQTDKMKTLIQKKEPMAKQPIVHE